MQRENCKEIILETKAEEEEEEKNRKKLLTESQLYTHTHKAHKLTSYSLT